MFLLPVVGHAGATAASLVGFSIVSVADIIDDIINDDGKFQLAVAALGKQQKLISRNKNGYRGTVV